MLRFCSILPGVLRHVPPRKPVLSSRTLNSLCASFATSNTIISEIIGIMSDEKITEKSMDKKKGKKGESEKEAEAKEEEDIDAESLMPKKLVPVMIKDKRGAMRVTKVIEERDEVVEKKYVQRTYKGPKPQDMMKQLKHFQYYPPRIQKWVSYARMPKGRYNAMGYWKKDYEAMGEEVEKRERLAEEGRRRMLSKEVVEQRENFIRDNPLPLDLVGKYRFGVLAEEAADLNPKLKEWLTFRHANNSEINKYRVDQAMLKWQTKPYDSGSTGVQIAVLTERINYVTAHLTKHRGDVKTKLGLRGLINKRYKLMKYCKRKNITLYYDLIKDLNIKDMA